MARLNGKEAAKLAGVSGTTITRWIQSGMLPAERDDLGRWSISRDDLDSFLEARSEAAEQSVRDPRPAQVVVDLAVARERIRGLEGLVAQQREWLTLAEERNAMLLRALPAPERRWWWWPFPRAAGGAV